MRFLEIRVVGGGARNRLLNQFTADATGRPVVAGPVEATALGNIAMQMLATGAVGSLQEARAVIDRSFPTERFEPSSADRWECPVPAISAVCLTKQGTMGEIIMKRRHFVGSMMGLPLAATIHPEAERPAGADHAAMRPALNRSSTARRWTDGRAIRNTGAWRTARWSGEITPETLIKSNTFIIWRGGSPKDFELKADYRITSGGNSGINYRSVVVPDTVTPSNKFAMRGYQADIDGANRYTGQNYEEKGRLFLATRGQMTHVIGVRKPVVLATMGDDRR